MILPILFFASALAVKHDQTALRASCEAGDETIANLKAGTPVEVRFRLSDGSDCYKIAVNVDGKSVTGYVPGSALTGVETFDHEVSSAASVDVARALTPIEAETKMVVIRGGGSDLKEATRLLDASQPAEALGVLQRALPRYPRNPNVLLLAGLAAYRSDQLRQAIDYWQQSLELAPNDALQRVYDKVRRESDADRSGDKLVGMRVMLRYEGASLPADTARSLVATLDREFSRISNELGCRADERIVAIVQSRETYLRSTGAAEWSGGQYDGRIHISWPATDRELAHELVHACLNNLQAPGTRWPAWLHEGLAQKLSGDTLSDETRRQLRELAGAHTIPRLENLRQDWSRMNANNARLSYSLALAAADALYQNYSNYGIRNILNDPQALRRITPELDRSLGF